MRVIVNDANILIDLVELKLLPHFFTLEFEFLTTELVLAELLRSNTSPCSSTSANGQLIVYEMTGDDLTEICLIQASKPTLSEQDCSAFYQARHLATLITSNNTLRAFAKEQQLEVHGHLWV